LYIFPAKPFPPSIKGAWLGWGAGRAVLLASLLAIMEEQYSWLRRTRFSHTVYTRVDPSRAPIVPLSKDIERKLQKFATMGKSVSMPVDWDDEDTGTALKHSSSLPLVRSALQFDRDKANKQKRADLEIPLSPPMNSGNSKGLRTRSLVKSPSSVMLLNYLSQGEIPSMLLLSYLNKEAPSIQGSSPQKADRPQHKPRSKSPLPTTVPSEVFQEAKSSSRRFASPPPQRRKSFYGRSFASPVSDLGQSPDWCSAPAVSGKHKSTNKYNGGRKVSAVNPTDDQRVQRVRIESGSADNG
jgi:hypothetical protein